MKTIKTFIQHLKESANEDAINSLTVETVDKILDALLKNPNVTSKALSAIRKSYPLLYQRLVASAEKRGKARSLDTHSDLGDLGF